VLQKSLALGGAEDERFRRRPLGGGRWRDKVRGESMGVNVTVGLTDELALDRGNHG